MEPQVPSLTPSQDTSVASTPHPSASAPPRPTAAPFFLALGITMFFWGIVTSPVMSIGGLILLVGALWSWIRAIAKQWRE